MNDSKRTNRTIPYDRCGSVTDLPVIAVCGVKNSGKTTLITKLIPFFRAQGLHVAVIKHDGHDFEPDVPGTDSSRHREAGAYGCAVFSDHRFMITKEQRETTAEELASFFPEADLILLEGFKYSRCPKLEVIRRGNSTECISEREGLLAIVTDLPDAGRCGSEQSQPSAEAYGFPQGIPVLDLNDPEKIAAFIIGQGICRKQVQENMTKNR